MIANPQTLADLIASHRFNYNLETELQNGVEDVLKKNGLHFVREARLNERDRIDFLVGEVGIEIKTDGSVTQLLRQLLRYSTNERIGCLIVITSRARLTRLPGLVGSKPLLVVNVGNPF